MKKDIILYIIFSLLNIAVAYLITSLLNIKNIVLFKSYTAMGYTITYEVIIWFILTLIEGYFYSRAIKKDEA